MATYQITTPDGAVYRVTQPDPAPAVDPAALNYDIPQGALPQASPMTPEAPPGMAETKFAEPANRQMTVPETIQFGTQATGRALADIAGSVYDMPNAAFMGGQWAANEVGQWFGDPETPSVGLGEALGRMLGDEMAGPPASLSDAIADTSSDLFTNLGAPPMSREDMGGLEPFYDPLRYAMGAAAGGTGLATAARRAPADLSRKTLFDNLTEPYLDAPKTTIARDAAAGFGAGVGQDMAPDDGLGAILGPLLGAIAGSTAFGSALTAGKMGMTALDNLKGDIRVGDEWFSPGVVDQVRQRLQTAAQDPLTGEAGHMDAAQQLAEQAGRFSDADLPMPDAGLLTDNLGLQQLGHDMRVRNKLPFMQNDRNMKEAATERVGTLVDPEADQGAVSRAAAAARLERLAPFVQGVDQARGAVDDITAGVTRESGSYEPFRSRPEHYRTEASRNLDDVIVNEAYIPARQRKNELYDNIDPNREEFVSIEPLRGRLQQLRDQINEFGPEALQMPADFVTRIQDVLNRAAPDEDMMASVGELAGLRPFISTARSKARKGGNMDLADNLGAIQTQIDDIIGDHPAAAEANRNYRDNFAPTFRPGPGDEAAKFTQQIDREPFDDAGNPTRTQTPPERTGDRFLRAPEKAAAVDRMIQAAENPERGRAAVRDYFMSDFAGSVFDNDGAINPNRAAAWLQQNEPTLAQFPDLLRDFERRVARSRDLRGAADQADEALTAAQRRLEQEGRTVERGAIGTLLSDDPRDVAKGLLTGQKYGAGRSFDEIEQIIGNDETARRGWQAAVSEVLSDMVTDTAKTTDGEFVVNTTKLSSLMKRHEDDLARVYDENQMNTLRQGQSLLEALRNIPKGAVGGSNTAEKTLAWLTGPTTEALIKARYGVLKGGGILRTLRIVVESLPNNQRNVDELMRRAYFNPDVMEFLLEGKVRDFSRGESNKYVRGLLAGYVAAQGDNAPEEE